MKQLTHAEITCSTWGFGRVHVKEAIEAKLGKGKCPTQGENNVFFGYRNSPNTSLSKTSKSNIINSEIIGKNTVGYIKTIDLL